MSKIYETINSCRICDSKDIREVLNLGDQPPANSLYRVDDSQPPSLPLRLLFCIDCSTVQLGESVEPEYLFGEYLWVTGTSSTAEKHSHYFAKNALLRCDIKQPNVVEIASNDGTFLKRFLDAGCGVLGIDPAKNIAEEALANGIPTLNEFFTAELAQDMVDKKGCNDIVFARNVIPHVKAIHSVIEGIKILLDDNGIGIIEFHDAGLILDELHYDSIYHEHLFLFSLKTISKLLEMHSLYVFDILPSPISGGSWVIYFSRQRKTKTEALKHVEQHEVATGINTLVRWLRFADEANAHAEDLKGIISGIGTQIMAYGASARSSTLLNFCQINHDQVLAIIDKNPLKHDLITPGSNIPIVSFEQGLQQINLAKEILLLAWNFQEEIVEDLRAAGYKGKFIVPLPNKVNIK